MINEKVLIFLDISILSFNKYNKGDIWRFKKRFNFKIYFVKVNKILDNKNFF